MYRTRTLLAGLALLLSGLVVRAEEPLGKQEADKAILMAIFEDLRQIKSDLKLLNPAELSLTLKDVQGRLDRLEGRMKSIEATTRPGTTISSSFYPTEPTLAEVLAAVKAVDARVGTLQRMLEGQRYPTPTPEIPTPRLARIKLDNRSLVVGTFTVDGVPYTVLPGQSYSVPAPLDGTFFFRIEADGYGVLHSGRRTIQPGEAGRVLYLDLPGSDR